MNIEQAKTISIVDLLNKLNIKPAKETYKEAWFLSPWRKEKTASFKVNKKTNTCFDFGHVPSNEVVRKKKAWDAVDFACEHLEQTGEPHTVSDALRWLSNMGGLAPFIQPISVPNEDQEDATLSVIKVRPVIDDKLIRYGESRGITESLTKQWFKQLTIHNGKSGKNFIALGFRNIKGGYELRNPFFKGTVGQKTISFIRGSNPERPGINIFEGAMDYVTVLAKIGVTNLADDTIVLNSTSCLNAATPLILNYPYQYIQSWMDNDTTGEKATAALANFVKTQKEMRLRIMNKLYTRHKDVNAWYMNSLALQ